MTANPYLLYARLIRRSYRRTIQILRWRQFGFRDSPILFANSFPKSGTHLLTQVLQGFSNIGPAVNCGLPAIVTFSSQSGKQRPNQQILTDLRRLLPGDISYGHLHAIPEVVNFLSKENWVACFILRDPRDVVISHVYYVTEMEPQHIHHHYYAQVLKTFDDRLRTSILGRQDIDFPFPNIRDRFDPYLGWMNCPDLLSLRFEDFLADQPGTIGKIVDHAVARGFPLRVERQKAVKQLQTHIDPKRSPTFRSGKAGGWRQAFSEENKEIFKDVAGDLLIQLGYEENDQW